MEKEFVKVITHEGKELNMMGGIDFVFVGTEEGNTVDGRALLIGEGGWKTITSILSAIRRQVGGRMFWKALWVSLTKRPQKVEEGML